MVLSNPAECRLNGSWSIKTQRDDIVVIVRVDRHAGQVAGVRQEPDLVAERLLVSSVDLRR